MIVFRKANKQTCILVCLCMSMWLCGSGARANQSHSSPPHLKGLRVVSACVCTRVCAGALVYWCSRVSAGTISLISALCLFFCRCTPRNKNTHSHTSNTTNTGKHISRNDRKSTLWLRYSISVLRNVKDTNTFSLCVCVQPVSLPRQRKYYAPPQRLPPTVLFSMLYVPQSRETRTLTQAMKARQKRPVAGPTTGFGSNKAPCIEEKQRVRLPAQGCYCDLCMCACEGVCWYYFANLSTVSVCLPVHTVTQEHIHKHKQHKKRQANTCQVMIENQHLHSSTVSQYSTTKNTHTHESDESPAKTPGSRTDNWLSDKTSILSREETES